MKKIRFNRGLILGLILILSIICISSVSAAEIEDNSSLEISEDIQIEKLTVSNISKLEVSYDDEIPDEPDLVYNDTIYVTSSDVDDYFENGVLTSKFSNKTLIFSQDFENLGKLTVDADNVVLRGVGFSLKNTVFELNGNNITLSDLNMELDSSFPNNDGSAIQILSDNAKLINLNINYIVPSNVEAYAIYATGSSRDPIRNLKILNSNINFEGHNDKLNVYNCAVKLSNCENPLIKNNTISSQLPLKDIIFGTNGAELASDLVLTVGIGGCTNLTFVENTLIAEVNKKPENSYPSLDCIMVSKSENSLIANNSIYMTDFVTAPGVDNYLYGLDIYNLNNMTVVGNNISIITTGGKLAAGTAYPIQITGPISNVTITKNDLYSFSNGPNIGIYSQNYYGSTSLLITNNKINVTGLAGTHEWALVAGIETQDTFSTIHNNTIEVHSVADVSLDDNLYGISYRQSTAGDHKYDIQDNLVFSDGYYAVNLLTSVDSKVNNNLLVSYNSNADSSKSGFQYGDISKHDNIEFYNNRVISAFDYFASRENSIDNGEEFNYNTPSNSNGVSNNINGNNIPSGEEKKSHTYNPLIPGSSSQSGINNGNQGGLTPSDGTDSEKGNEDDGYNTGNSEENGGGSSSGNSTRMSLRELIINFINSNTEGGKVNTTSYNGHNVNVVSNSSDATPSAEGSESAASQSKSAASPDSSAAGESSSVSKKIFELDEKNEIEDFMPSIYMIIPALIFLFIGIRRKKSYLE